MLGSGGQLEVLRTLRNLRLRLSLPVLAAAVWSVGCEAEVRHPIGEVPTFGSSARILEDTLPPAQLDPVSREAWAATRRAILDAEPGPYIGALEGGGPDVLGSVVDARFDANGNLYLLDFVASTVTVFDSTGDFVHRMGGEGDGPLELSWRRAGFGRATGLRHAPGASSVSARPRHYTSGDRPEVV